MKTYTCPYCQSTKTLLTLLDHVSGEHSLFCHTCALSTLVIPEPSTESVDKQDVDA